jgi:peptidoglycan/xylan/chitin deacetylase (PgdA/CDA1 family)
VPGAVLLLHDGEGAGGDDGAVAAMRPELRRFLGAATAAGYRFTTLGDAVAG